MRGAFLSIIRSSCVDWLRVTCQVALQARADGEDVVQSVFRTFFQRDSEGKFRVDHSDELWKLLVTITLRKARSIWRKNTAAQRSVGREVSLDSNNALALFAKDPTVVEALVLADEIDTALNGLGADNAQALELRMGGYTLSEAAELMGITRQSFYRLLEPIKARLIERDFAIGDDSESRSAGSSPE